MTVVDYIIELEEPWGTIFGYVHDHMQEHYPHVESSMKWDIPFYLGKAWIFYGNPIKKKGRTPAGVEFVFLRTSELSNDHGVLDMKKRKRFGGITITSKETPEYKVLLDTIAEAVILDETVPYKVKSK